MNKNKSTELPSLDNLDVLRELWPQWKGAIDAEYQSRGFKYGDELPADVAAEIQAAMYAAFLRIFLN